MEEAVCVCFTLLLPSSELLRQQSGQAWRTLSGSCHQRSFWIPLQRPRRDLVLRQTDPSANPLTPNLGTSVPVSWHHWLLSLHTWAPQRRRLFLMMSQPVWPVRFPSLQRILNGEGEAGDREKGGEGAERERLREGAGSKERVPGLEGN